MEEDQVGLRVGGQMNFAYHRRPEEFFDGADDTERIRRMLDAYV